MVPHLPTVTTAMPDPKSMSTVAVHVLQDAWSVRRAKVGMAAVRARGCGTCAFVEGAGLGTEEWRDEWSGARRHMDLTVS